MYIFPWISSAVYPMYADGCEKRRYEEQCKPKPVFQTENASCSTSEAGGDKLEIC